MVGFMMAFISIGLFQGKLKNIIYGAYRHIDEARICEASLEFEGFLSVGIKWHGQAEVPRLFVLLFAILFG
jgi:hypothetical protein